MLGLGWLLIAAAPAEAARQPCPGTGTLQTCLLWTGTVVKVSDGDTIAVDVDRDGTRRPAKVRLTGIQAMELTHYAKLTRAGECHGVDATRTARAARQRQWRARASCRARSGQHHRRATPPPPPPGLGPPERRLDGCGHRPAAGGASAVVRERGGVGLERPLQPAGRGGGRAPGRNLGRTLLRHRSARARGECCASQGEVGRQWQRRGEPERRMGSNQEHRRAPPAEPRRLVVPRLGPPPLHVPPGARSSSRADRSACGSARAPTAEAPTTGG